MHRSIVSKEWIDLFILNNNELLPNDAFFRFFSVVRIKPEEEIAVFDGQGREIKGFLKPSNKSAHFINGILYQEEKPLPELVVVQAALEEAKIKETIKRGCEYGVDRFIIFDAAKSERFCFKKLLAKQEKLRLIAEDACRQSGRLFVPPIEFSSLSQMLQGFDPLTSFAVYGDLSEKKLLSEALAHNPSFTNAFFIVVGPEGGLSLEECAQLKGAQFLGVSWSPFVLRSELACLSAASLFHAYKKRA